MDSVGKKDDKYKEGPTNQTADIDWPVPETTSKAHRYTSCVEAAATTVFDLPKQFHP
jgi:hypothetical protein